MIKWLLFLYVSGTVWQQMCWAVTQHAKESQHQLTVFSTIPQIPKCYSSTWVQESCSTKLVSVLRGVGNHRRLVMTGDFKASARKCNRASHLIIPNQGFVCAPGVERSISSTRAALAQPLRLGYRLVSPLHRVATDNRAEDYIDMKGGKVSC